MAYQQMTFQDERVTQVLNQISVCVEDIATRNRRFIELLDEKNQKTQNKFPLFVYASKGIEKEKTNLDAINETMETIKAETARYAEALRQGGSDEGLRRAFRDE